MPLAFSRTGIKFSSQIKCKQFVKELRAVGGDRIVSPGQEEFSGKDSHDILIDLFTRHPNWDGYMPPKFRFGKGEWNEDAWFYLDKGGEWVCYSMDKCVTGRDKTEHSKRMSILRELIAPQIMEFPKIKCHNGCDNYCQIEVDHVLSFKDLVGDFMSERSYPDIIKGSPNRFEDESFSNDWINHHKENAWLRALCKECHDRKTHS